MRRPDSSLRNTGQTSSYYNKPKSLESRPEICRGDCCMMTDTCPPGSALVFLSTGPCLMFIYRMIFHVTTSVCFMHGHSPPKRRGVPPIYPVDKEKGPAECLLHCQGIRVLTSRAALVRHVRLWYQYELMAQRWIDTDICIYTISCSPDRQSTTSLQYFQQCQRQEVSHEIKEWS